MSSLTRLQALRNALRQLRDEERPPEHLVRAAMALSRSAPPMDVFRLRAAASDAAREGLLCTSESGLLTLGIYVARGGDARHGKALLTIHLDHRAAFEGRAVRIFVITEAGERVLTQSVVRDGEVLADIDLDDLDLTRRDAINVVFGPVQES